MILILSLLLISCLSPVQLQESSISFSPTSSVCTGDTLSITCYGYPPEGMELEPFAEIVLASYPNNQGEPLAFTINSSIPGYSVTGDIPVRGNIARLQLTILSYQLSLSNRPIQCRAYPAGDSSSYLSVSSHTPPIAGYPYAPYIHVSTATPPPAVVCPTITISWSPHNSANIDKYYLFRTVMTGDTQQQEFLATTSDSEHIVNHPLNITFVYEYFVVASNCVGNSSSTANAVVSFYVVIGNLSLSYMPRSNLLSLDWNLTPHTLPRYIRYSLQLTYSPSPEGDTTTQIYLFSRLTTENSYLTRLPDTLSADTNISACIEAVEQCDQLMPPYMVTMECVYIITATAVPTLSPAEESTLAVSVLFVVVSVLSLLSVAVSCLLAAYAVHLKAHIHRNTKPIPDDIAHF